MYKIKNIKVSSYLKLDYTFKYDMLFDLIPEKNEFNGSVCDFDSLTFDEVSLIKRILQEPDMDGIKMLYDICYNQDYTKGLIIDFFQSRKWIDKKIIEIIETESKLLFVSPDPKLIAAGVEDLSRYGVMNTKIDLGMQFGKSPKEIGEWKYNDVLVIQARNNMMRQIEKKYK